MDANLSASPHYDALSIERSSYNGVFNINDVDCWEDSFAEKLESNPDCIDEYISKLQLDFGVPIQGTCKYCSQSTEAHRHSTYTEETAEREDPLTEADLTICPNCLQWSWRWSHFDVHYGDWEHLHIAHSKLRTFEESLPEGFEADLAKYLKQHPEAWNIIPPARLESFLAQIMRANFDHAEVIHVGGPDDRGVDVIFIDSSIKQWLIQIKRRGDPMKAESVDTLRNLLGAMLLHNTPRAILVSTATRFSPQTIRDRSLAKSSAGYEVKLIDRGHLTRMLGRLPLQPWLQLLDHVSPEAKSYLLENTSHLIDIPWLSIDSLP